MKGLPRMLARWAQPWQTVSRPLGRRVQGWSHRLGMPGRVGLCLCALAAALWAVVLPLQSEQVDERAAHNQWLEQRLSGMSNGSVPSAQGAPGASGASLPGGVGPAWREWAPQAHWAQVWQALAPRDTVGAHQSALLRTAPGLVAEPVSFSHEQLAALPGLMRWRMSVSTAAPWPQQMQWLRRVLADPAISVDAIALQRERPLDEVWQMRLGVSLWTRETRSPVADRPDGQPERGLRAAQEESK